MNKFPLRPEIDSQPILVSRGANIVFPHHNAISSETYIPEQST